ncbi:peptidoglycan-binding domain-containing protein [Sphingomonas solaris]
MYTRKTADAPKPKWGEGGLTRLPAIRPPPWRACCAGPWIHAAASTLGSWGAGRAAGTGGPMSLPSWIRERIKEFGDRYIGRPPTGGEIALAQTVFGHSIQYDRVAITTFDMGAPVTLMDMARDGNGPLFLINWPDGFRSTFIPADSPATLIHELTHVWQGQHGTFPPLYMAQAAWAQVSSGVRDILRTRQWRGWDKHRGTAYVFRPSEVGRPWSSFNAEQQASLVQSWFMPENVRYLRIGPHMAKVTNFGDGVYGGNRSEGDPRFPYIRDVVRTGDRHAAYRPLKAIGGSDPAIRAMQEKLAALGYLDARQVDGVVGRSRSATLEAVAAFQRRNGLKPDRELGGPHSLTRRKLAQPLISLQRAL